MPPLAPHVIADAALLALMQFGVAASSPGLFWHLASISKRSALLALYQSTVCTTSTGFSSLQPLRIERTATMTIEIVDFFILVLESERENRPTLLAAGRSIAGSYSRKRRFIKTEKPQRTNVRTWSNSTVRINLADRRSGKFTHCLDRQLSAQSGPCWTKGEALGLEFMSPEQKNRRLSRRAGAEHIQTLISVFYPTSIKK
jgi:hypothetical protein